MRRLGARLIGGLAPAVSYPTNEPVLPGSVLFSLEIHAGRGTNATSHSSALRVDLLRYDTPIVGVGDFTEDGTTGQDTTALAVIAGIPGDVIGLLVGNHDLQGGRSGPTLQTAWGVNGLNWTYDMGDFLVIGISPDTGALGNGADATVTLEQATLDYLDAQLDAATKDCWIACHSPLPGITGAPTSEWWINPLTSVEAILDAHDNAIAWVSGHIHQEAQAALRNVGSRSVVNANVPAIAYTNPGDDITDPVQSILATHIDGGVELRIRDHNRRHYMPWSDGNLVKTLEAT